MNIKPTEIDGLRPRVKNGVRVGIIEVENRRDRSLDGSELSVGLGSRLVQSAESTDTRRFGSGRAARSAKAALIGCFSAAIANTFKLGSRATYALMAVNISVNETLPTSLEMDLVTV